MNKFDVLLIVAIILMICVGAYLVFSFKDEGNSCISDPIKYYENHSNSNCFCYP
ncbi:MAG: hypothetical protein WC679_12440 [Bacteroidales bacterium]|jgi:L-asparagine transporter-like permease